MPNINTKSFSTRRHRRSVPTSPSDLPAVVTLRTRAVLSRVRSPALARAISELAFSCGAESWRTAR